MHRLFSSTKLASLINIAISRLWKDNFFPITNDQLANCMLVTNLLVVN